MVFVHEGEYWAFGHELVHREKGGGYGVPLTLHSKDGETWVSLQQLNGIDSAERWRKKHKAIMKTSPWQFLRM
jgi:hypothetical protein